MKRQPNPVEPLILTPEELQEIMLALHIGEADALVVRTPHGEDIYTLESVNAPYRLFVEQMQEGALTICDKGTIAYCNLRFAEMVGGEPQRLVGRLLEEFIEPESMEAFCDLKENGCLETARGECLLRCGDGSTHRVQVCFSPLRPHRMGFCSVIVTDLAHVQRHEELSAAVRAAEEANAAKDQFLAMLSHELRTPLNAVLGWAQMLQRGTMDQEQMKRGMETIERNARAQMQLISDLLDVSRIVAGKLRLDMALVKPAKIVTAAMDAVMPAAQQKGMHMTSSLDDAAGLVHGDADRIQQALVNLLNNAIKFTPAGGHVRLDLKGVDGQVEIAVTDDGQGINPEDLPRIFDRFEQARGGASQVGGLGLGLFIARQVIDKQGGRIDAFSAGPGTGATFTIRLPVAAVELERAQQRQDAAVERYAPLNEGAGDVTLRGLRLLVVDDTHDSLTMMEVSLREAGAEVWAASSAAEALEMLRQKQPDVIISDLNMPEQDGFEFIRQVRQAGYSGRDLPAIALTALARSEDRRRALLAGYQLHVTKPVDQEELIAAVAGVATLTVGPRV